MRIDSTISRLRIGFTLVELLVVVSIIGLLLSIAVPTLARARKNAKSIVCISNLKQIGTAWQSYLSDYNDHFPFGRSDLTWFYGGNHPTIANKYYGKLATDHRPLNPYIGSEFRNEKRAEVFRCPFDREIAHITGKPGPTMGNNTYDFYGNSYKMNHNLLHDHRWNDEVGLMRYFPVRLGKVTISHGIVLLVGDCQWYYAIQGNTVWDGDFHDTGGYRMNLLFLDGHAAATEIVEGEYVTSRYSVAIEPISPDEE